MLKIDLPSETTGHGTKHTNTIYGDVPSTLAFRACLFNHIEQMRANQTLSTYASSTEDLLILNTQDPLKFWVFSFKLKSI